MADILIKNVPKEIHEKLKEMALFHHRSMTKEVLVVLEKSLPSIRWFRKQPRLKRLEVS